MTWIALDVAYELVTAVKPVAEVVARYDLSLASQLRRAAASVALNLAEGDGRVAGDRRRHFHIALGSAKEVRAALRIAALLEYAQVDAAAQVADRAAGLVYGLVRAVR